MLYKPLFFQFFSISNFFLNVFTVFLFLFFGYHEIAAQGFVAISISNVFTYGFSGNFRNIYLGSKNILSLKKIILFRILVGLFAVLSSSILIYFFLSKSNFIYLFSILFLTISSFILELLIARAEKNDLPNKYHALNVLLYFLVSIVLVYLNLLDIYVYYIFFHIFINFIIFRKFFKNLFFEEMELFINFKKNINLGIYSTFLKTVSNLIWRYSAFLLLGSSKSAILFMAFSLGSFFGTLFDISYGALFLKKLKKSANFFLHSLFIVYSFLSIFLILFFKSFSAISTIEFQLLFSATIISLMGSYVITYALKLRQYFFEMKNMQNYCFKIDISLYVFNSLIIPILFFIGEDLVMYAYLISSTFFYFMYKVFVVNDFKRKPQT